jgi:hypothetical protein
MSPGDIKVVAVALFIVIGFGIYRFIQHFRGLVPRPDPWGKEIEAAVYNDSAVPLCHRCFTEHENTTLFCPKCGAAVGDYNNVMPWVQVFSEGEVLRNSLFDRLRVNAITIAGFFVFTLALGVITGVGLILMPFFWAMFAKNVARNRFLEAEEKISNTNETSL